MVCLFVGLDFFCFCSLFVLVFFFFFIVEVIHTFTYLNPFFHHVMPFFHFLTACLTNSFTCYKCWALIMPELTHLMGMGRWPDSLWFYFLVFFFFVFFCVCIQCFVGPVQVLACPSTTSQYFCFTRIWKDVAAVCAYVQQQTDWTVTQKGNIKFVWLELMLILLRVVLFSHKYHISIFF